MKNNLTALLKQYTPHDSDEQKFKQQMLDFIAQNLDCFKRALASGHITASAWLVNRDNTKALLMHHAKLDNWFQLGGHCDSDPDVLAVAIKEAQEESGITGIVPVSDAIFDIDIHLIPANSHSKAHYHYDVRFLLKTMGDESIVQNRESKELRWITKDRSKLPTMSRSVVRMFDKWVQR